MRVSALLLCTALAIAPGFAHAAEIAPADFAMQAAGSDLFEIQSSELALQQGQSEKVRDFAKEMVAAHKENSASLKEAAAKEGVELSSASLPKELQEKLAALKGTSGPTFDAAYLSAQVSAHTSAVELYGNFAKDGEGGPLKAFADQTFPTIRMHLIRVRSMISEDANP